MSELDQLFAKYSESHQNKINKAIHWLAVPTIVFSILGLIWSIPMPAFFASFPYFNWASLVIAFALYYYYQLSPILAFAMIVLIGIFSYFIVMVELNANAGGMAMWQFFSLLFIIAWIFQFIGHYIEGKKPSFFDDLKFLLIGPIWLMHFIFKSIGLPYQSSVK